MSITPSDEQLQIITEFKRGYNIRISAVAGSGKTTTLLFLAEIAIRFFGSDVLILTYNVDLKEDVNKIINSSEVLKGKCKIYTYHGFASKIYKKSTNDDFILDKNLMTKPKITTFPKIIFLDEVQDMNKQYYKLVSFTLKHGNIMVVVGDERQCINEYLNATTEYLVNCEKYFDTGRPWKKLNLRTSYRMTPEIANFVNNHVLGQQLVIPGNKINNNVKPIYYYGIWDFEKLIKKMSRKYSPEDIVIIIPSLKSAKNVRSPIGQMLSKQIPGILFHIKDEDNKCKDKIIEQNKIVITTFNAMKGREKKCVIILGFDESFFDFFYKSWDPKLKRLPNILYVATTRAKEQLILIQDKKSKPLRTINLSSLSKDCKIYGSQHDPIEKNISDSVKSITDLLKHRPLDDILNLTSLIYKKDISLPIGNLNYNSIVQFSGYYEDMRSFYGTLIPIYSQFLKEGSTWLTEELIDGNRNKNKNFDDIKRVFLSLLYKNNKTIREWMELVVMTKAINDNFHFYKDQITNYDWVDENFVTVSSKRIIDILPQNGKFEVNHNYTDPMSQKTISGTFDYLTEFEIWEFKCTNSLDNIHFAQCGAYISLYYHVTGKLLPCKLFNVRTGELFEVKLGDPSLFLTFLLKKT